MKNVKLEFRAYTESDKEMFKVRSIDFELKEVRSTSRYGVVYKFSDVQLMQASDTEDINGNKVFDKDILKLTSKHSQEVEYGNVFLNDSCFVVLMAGSSDVRSLFEFENYYIIEILGNTLENKELLRNIIKDAEEKLKMETLKKELNAEFEKRNITLSPDDLDKASSFLIDKNGGDARETTIFKSFNEACTWLREDVPVHELVNELKSISYDKNQIVDVKAFLLGESTLEINPNAYLFVYC